MYVVKKNTVTGFNINESTEGETIEQKIQRVTINKEPIKDGAALIYTERSEGVKAGYNIRTDRFEIAIDAMDKVQASVQAKRDSKATMNIVKDEKTNNGVENIQGTEGTNN